MRDVQQTAKEAIKRLGWGKAAAELGVSRATLGRLNAGRPVSARTLEKIKPRVRHAGEFAATGTTAFTAPRRRNAAYSWDLESIRAARDAQLSGSFSLPAKMAKAMRTDAAIYTARRARLAPLDAIESKLCAAPGARGEAVAKKAIVSCIIPRTVLKSIAGTLLDHNVAFGYVRREPSADGGRVDMRLEEWPIEFVKWDDSQRAFYTQVEGGPRERIVHGDGRWLVFRLEAEQPWANSTLGAACLVWAANAEGLQAWAAALNSHGKPAVFGELPAGMVMADENNVLSPGARTFLQMIADVVEGGAPAGLRPPGSKIDLLFNGSTAWQIFKELIDNREKAATRIYLGTDAILGSVGGAPGVDISALFGLTSTLLQGDFKAIEEGVRTGILEPWAAVNFGDSSHAPRIELQLPDPDENAAVETRDARRKTLLDTIEKYRELGMVIDQAVIDKLARELKVTDPPQLAPAAERSVALPLAPTDIARAVTLNEIRGSLGLPAITDGRGEKTLPQLEAEAAAVSQAAPAVTPAAALRVIVGGKVARALRKSSRAKLGWAQGMTKAQWLSRLAELAAA